MEPVKCLFCSNSPEYKPLQEMGQYGARIYFCFNCNAEYTFWNNEQNLYYSLYAVINNRMYRWSSNPHNSYLYYIKEPGEPGVKANKKLELLKHFEGPSNVTPTNIKEKLKIILTFL